ncbi:MAG: class I SAM-dependent methyltransferase [Anaerolineae bacterium]
MTGNDVVIEAFTELAPRYQETVNRELRQFWGLNYEELVDWLTEVASVNEGDIILDVATGTALIPLKLVDKVGARGRVVGLDITLAMLKHGRKNVEATGSSSRISLVCASAMAMPFVGGVFDAAICGLGTHHMDVSQMLSEMRRVLKTGGNLIMADVGASPFWRSLWGTALLKILLLRYGLTRRSARAQAEVEAFPNVRTADEWRTILSDFGFANIEITESPARHRWYPCALMMRAAAI